MLRFTYGLFIAIALSVAFLVTAPTAQAQSLGSDSNLSFASESAFGTTDIASSNDSNSDTTDLEAGLGVLALGFIIDNSLHGGHGGSSSPPASGLVGVAPEMSSLGITILLVVLLVTTMARRSFKSDKAT